MPDAGAGPLSTDVAIIGGGAAGLASAIFSKRQRPNLRVTVLEGARSPGAKILVSGGSRCNVTNVSVAETDYNGSKPTLIRRVLRTLPVADTVAFFAGLGVPLHEEANGKLFPDSNRSRDVLAALLRECDRLGVQVACSHRVNGLAITTGGFTLDTTGGRVQAGAVVLATGGQSLPKSGSDGAGYGFARAFGHSVTRLTEALTPLVLDAAADATHLSLSGITTEVELSVWSQGRVSARTRGALLFTHFGVSGPAVLDASRHWLQARHDRDTPRLTVNLCPGESFDQVERWLIGEAAARPKAGLVSVFASRLPMAVARALAWRVGAAAEAPLAHLGRDARRRAVHALVEWPLAVTGGRGWSYAEATAGGVPLDEVDAGTMESRRQPGLFLVGEVLDVDGRLGGFNFQWAWASARAAATGLAKWSAQSGPGAA